MGFLKKDDENEVSGGQVFGYILIALAALLVISFLIFVGIKKFGGSDSDGNVNMDNGSVRIETTYEADGSELV